VNALTVLLAEDDAVTRLDLRRIVEEAGYRVCGETGDGRKAVARAFELRPDVIVMDVGLPGIDGVEAARQMGAVDPIPIVLLTGYGYGEVVARAIDAGVSAFVKKPFQESELLDAMRAALEPRHNDIGLAYLQLASSRSRLTATE
jgi:two-component system, response regulator PdtaR